MNGGERWVALVRGTDRPGTLTALTSVFSTRGVSFESLSTGAVDGDVGLEQSRADLREGVVHLLGVELPPCAELLEDAVQAVGECVEHKW